MSKYEIDTIPLEIFQEFVDVCESLKWFAKNNDMENFLIFKKAKVKMITEYECFKNVNAITAVNILRERKLKEILE